MRILRTKDHLIRLIADGTKTLDVRVGFPFVLRISADERVVYQSRYLSQVVHVNQVRVYKSFEAMLKWEDFSRMAMGDSPEEALKFFRELYPADKEALGVYVIDFHLLRKQ